MKGTKSSLSILGLEPSNDSVTPYNSPVCAFVVNQHPDEGSHFQCFFPDTFPSSSSSALSSSVSLRKSDAERDAECDCTLHHVVCRSRSSCSMRVWYSSPPSHCIRRSRTRGPAQRHDSACPCARDSHSGIPSFALIDTSLFPLLAVAHSFPF